MLCLYWSGQHLYLTHVCDTSSTVGISNNYDVKISALISLIIAIKTKFSCLYIIYIIYTY